jgi:hypothetical protein
MKPKFLTIILLCFFKTLTAQDTLQVTTEKGEFIPPQYSTAYDDVFMNKKETKWLLKLDITPFPSKLQILTYERKVNKNLSMNYGLGTAGRLNNLKLLLSVQPRWYFSKKTENVVNNLNGNYVGLNALYSLGQVIGQENKTNWGLVANYGIQKRIFNNWYFDYQLGVGVDKFNFPDSKTDDVHFRLHHKLALGLAFGGGKKGQTNTCDLFSCFEEESSLWKLDLLTLYNQYHHDVFYVNIHPEYERKIGQSSFSVNTDVTISYSQFDNQQKKYGLKAAIEPRFYYNMKKRIAKGKSANNLSGNYFSFNISGGYNDESRATYNIDGRELKAVNIHGTAYVIEAKWGIQRRLFKNGFLDFSLAPVRFQKSYLTYSGKTASGEMLTAKPYKPLLGEGLKYFKFENRISVPLIDFKVGFAF